MDMTVSVTEAKNKLTQLLTAVEKGERVTIECHGHVIAEIVKPSANTRFVESGIGIGSDMVKLGSSSCARRN